LTNPFGFHPRSIDYQSNELRGVARRVQGIRIADLATAPSITKGYVGSTLQVAADDGTKITLRGVRHSDAETFREVIKRDWVGYHTARFKSKRSAIDVVQQAMAELSEALRYPSACFLSPILEHARTLDNELLCKLPQEAVGRQVFSQVQSIRGFVKNAGVMRNQAIEKFEEQQLPQWQAFFDTFESNPLTPEQRISILADEDATLVLAGAGSGKTSVITAKAGYLIKSGIRRPEEILLLAFARDAAKEMSERIEERCGEPLEARTFHALAYDIIGAVEGSKPALAAHATDDKAYMALIKDILRALVHSVAEVSKSIIGWFSYARLEGKSEWDFKKKHNYYLNR
jgi:DNA helicase-4